MAYSNDVVLRGLPEASEELVVVPRFWNRKKGRFMFSTDFPWQLEGLMAPAEYQHILGSINNSILSAKQKRMNVLCFFCGGCCAMCCKPDVFMVAKETVFEPRGLSLRGPRVRMQPLSTGFAAASGPKQEIQWLEICPSVNGKPLYPMGYLHKKRERKRERRAKRAAKTKQRRKSGSASETDESGSDTSDSDNESKRSRARSKSGQGQPEAEALPGAMLIVESDGDEEEDDNKLTGAAPAVSMVKVNGQVKFEFAGAPKGGYGPPKRMTAKDKQNMLLNSMPLSEKAREAIRNRRERGEAPRARVVPAALRPHPKSHKLVGGQGEVDRKYIEAQRAKALKEREDKQRAVRQQIRQAAKEARDRSITLAAAAAAKAAEDALNRGINPFAPPMPMGPFTPMPGVAPQPMMTPGYTPNPQMYAPPTSAPMFRGPPAGFPGAGPPTMYGNGMVVSGPASSQQTPRRNVVRHARANSGGPYQVAVPAAGGQRFTEKRSPTTANLLRVASELERLRFTPGSSDTILDDAGEVVFRESPNFLRRETRSSAQQGVRKGRGAPVYQVAGGSSFSTLNNSSGSLRRSGEIR